MQTWTSLKSAKILLVSIVALGLFVVTTIGYKLAVRGKSAPPIPILRQSKENLQRRGEGTVLNTMSLPSDERRHLLDGNFDVVRITDKIANNCRYTFDSSVAPGSGAIELANPGQIFQFSDALIKDAPYRRLEFAGSAPNRCFLYYQHGGTMYPRFCLAVMDNSNRKILWVGVARKRAANVQELREMLLREDFDDKSGPEC